MAENQRAHITVFAITYILLTLNLVANCFLLFFSFTRKQKQMNRNSRRISKIIIRYLSIGNLIYTIFSLVVTTILLVGYFQKSTDMPLFRDIITEVTDSFFIVVAALITLLLYHRYTHMTTQALGQEPIIKKERAKIYIVQAYAIGLLLFTLSLLPIFMFHSWLNIAVRILLVSIKSVSIIFILYILCSSINGIRKEILKRYSNYVLNFFTLNGQFLYFFIILMFLVVTLLNEMYGNTQYRMISPLLSDGLFLMLPESYYFNDRNFKSYVFDRRRRRQGQVGPPPRKIQKDGKIEISNWIETKTTLTICNQCKLPQPQREPGEIYADDQQCETCKRLREQDNTESSGGEETTNDEDKASVISQIEALDLQKREISTPIKLLITSAFQIKAVHGLYLRESVVADHWKRISLKRTRSEQTTSDLLVNPETVKPRSQSELQPPCQPMRELITLKAPGIKKSPKNLIYRSTDDLNNSTIHLEELNEPDETDNDERPTIEEHMT